MKYILVSEFWDHIQKEICPQDPTYRPGHRDETVPGTQYLSKCSGFKPVCDQGILQTTKETGKCKNGMWRSPIPSPSSNISTLSLLSSCAGWRMSKTKWLLPRDRQGPARQGSPFTHALLNLRYLIPEVTSLLAGSPYGRWDEHWR